MANAAALFQTLGSLGGLHDPKGRSGRTRRRHQFIRGGTRPSPPRRSRDRRPQIVRAKFSSSVFAFATIPWKYPPGEDRK